MGPTIALADTNEVIYPVTVAKNFVVGSVIRALDWMRIRRWPKWLAIKIAEVVGGRVFLAAPVQAVWQRLPIPATVPKVAIGIDPAALRLAVVAHVYYPELLAEVLNCWQQVSRVAATAVPLHITTTDARASSVLAVMGDRESAAVKLHIGPNRGRDIAPFANLLNSGALDGYDAVLKLHTKRSPHLWTGNLRRKLLFTLLAGSERQVRQVQNLFRDPTVGMVGWRLSFRNKPSWWMGNARRVGSLSQQTAPRLQMACGFFEGSMFWVRPAALSTLRSLSLTPEDFEPELGQTDGALHHAVERMFTMATWAGGFRVCGMSGIELESRSMPAVPPEFGLLHSPD